MPNLLLFCKPVCNHIFCFLSALGIEETVKVNEVGEATREALENKNENELTIQETEISMLQINKTLAHKFYNLHFSQFSQFFWSTFDFFSVSLFQNLINQIETHKYNRQIGQQNIGLRNWHWDLPSRLSKFSFFLIIY